MMIVLLVIVALLSSCGAPDLIALPNLSTSAPTVLAIAPADKGILSPGGKVMAVLSRPVAPDSVSKETFIVTSGPIDMPASVLKENIDDGDIISVAGTYEIAQDGYCVIFRPAGALKTGSYGIILTQRMVGADRLPLAKMFVSGFTVAAEGTENTETGAEADLGVADPNTQPGETEEPKPDIPVILNEIFYDALESDTDGRLFVELTGDPKGDISGYKIVFVNGADGKITDQETLSEGSVIDDDGLFVLADRKDENPAESNVEQFDHLADFDPQNGPDAVQLIGRSGTLMDAVCYGAPPIVTAENGLAMCGDVVAPDAPSGKSISRPQDGGDLNVNSVPSPGSYDVTLGQ